MKKYRLLLLLLLFFPLITRAQYPFEKFKQIKYKEYKKWEIIVSDKDSMPVQRTIRIPKFDAKKTILKIEQTFAYTLPDSSQYSELKIYRNGKVVNEFQVGTLSLSEPLPVSVEDINGDGLSDLKIIFPNYACGNYNLYCQTSYLFQNKNGTFTEITYTDMFDDFVNRPERDFNNDGKYEIITQNFQRYGEHNYWLFNIYNYEKGKLVNVNYLANYPIMIPLDSHTVSKKIPREKMKQFEIKTPKK